MPNERPEFTNREKIAFENLKKICERPDVPQTKIERCAILKHQLQLEYDTKQSLIQLTVIVNLTSTRMKGINYINNRFTAMQTEVALLSNALQQASRNYDLILGTRASKPILGEIAFGLFLTVLPQLGVLSRSINLVGGEMTKYLDANLVSKNSWEFALNNLLKADVKATTEKVSKFGDFLDNISKDTIEAIKDPINAKEDVDKETAEKLKAFDSINKILTNVIKDCAKRLVLIKRFQPILFKYVELYEGDSETLLSSLCAWFGFIGFDKDMLYDENLFDLYSDLILYDMLRAYMTKWCATKVQMLDGSTPTKDKVNAQGFMVSGFDGLDKAQQALIYEKFGSKKWRDINKYHSVNDEKDLIRYMGVRVESYEFRIPTSAREY